MNKCYNCTKKLTIVNNYTCKCNNNFCSKCRHAESHKCTFDYKKHGKDILTNSLVKVTCDKIILI